MYILFEIVFNEIFGKTFYCFMKENFLSRVHMKLIQLLGVNITKITKLNFIYLFFLLKPVK